MKKRIVVTGLGIVSSIGIGKDDFWASAISGKSGISKVESFDTSGHTTHNGGEIKNFDPHKLLIGRKAEIIGRSSQLAIAAVKLALKDARLTDKQLRQRAIGLCMGTTGGEAQEIEKIDYAWAKEGQERIAAANIIRYPVNNISANVANILKIECLGRMFTTACAAGNYAMGYGIDLIKLGKTDLVIAGGADSFSYEAFTGFNQVGSVAPEKCQPFDKNRKGMMVGEGSGIIIMESLEHAQKRNAGIYAELLGYGLSCDAIHMTNPDVDGIAWCMQDAIKNAGINKNDVDYICAHGTGTKHNDFAEVTAIKSIFSSQYKEIPVNSLKSMLGHTMGAASAIEAASCCLTIKQGVIPPTINFETFDPDCDIDCVPNKARRKSVRIALNNAFAFGGNNSCLVIGQYEGEE